MLIALLTDFGTRDYFVAAMKGVILSICGTAQIIDVSHEVEPQNVQAGQFTLRACYQNFPPRTIFVAVVDPGVGSSRRAILVETERYYFIAPDNGLLSFVYHENPNFKVYELTERRFFNAAVSSTFHGRDIFATVAAHLASGVKSSEFGAEIKNFVCPPERQPRRISADIIKAEIIGVDRFGNLITNLRRENLPEKFTVEIADRRLEKLCGFFAEAEPNEVFMIFGSAGFLEIAARQNSAAKILKVEAGTEISVRNKL